MNRYHKKRNCISVSKCGEERGQSFSCKAGGCHKIYKEAEQKEASHIYRLRFDIKRNESAGGIYLKLESKSDTEFTAEYESSLIHFIASGGDFYVFSGDGNKSVILAGLEYEEKVWYTLEIWVDLKSGVVYTYSDDKKISETRLPFACDYIDGAWMLVKPGTDTNCISIDNVSFKALDNDELQMLKDEGVNVPEKLWRTVNLTVTSNETGNIFRNGHKCEMLVKAENLSGKDIDGELKISVLDSYKKQVWSHSEAVSVKNGEILEMSSAPEISRFDIYDFKAELCCGEDIICEAKKFSYVNLPDKALGNPLYGMCSHTNKVGRGYFDDTMSTIGKLGVGINREDLDWEFYEPTPGEYGFRPEKKAYFESWLSRLDEYNMKPLIIWWCENPAYGINWGEGVPKNEEQLNALEEAAYRFAKEYGDRCPYYELSNELNSFKRQDEVSCKQFAKALQSFYKGIKRGNPNAFVLGHAVGGIHVHWIENVLEAGGAGYCDGFGVHPYPRIPEANLVNELTELREMFDSHGWENLKIWITETVSSSSSQYNTEQQQAYYMIREFALFEATKLADKLFVYQIQTSEIPESDNEACFGMVKGWGAENPYSAKPVFMYLTNYMKLTSDAEFKEQLVKDNIYIYRWEKKNGNSLYMLHCNSSVEPVTIDFSAETGVMLDGNGNPSTLYGIGGKFSFVLTDDPVYFETSSSSFRILEKADFKVDKHIIDMTVGDKAEFNVEVFNGAEIQVIAKENYTVEADGSKYTITMNSLSEVYDFTARNDWKGRDLNRDYVKLLLKKGGKPSSVILVGINCKEKVYVDLNVRNTYGNGKSLEGEITVTNNSISNSISGLLKIESPVAIAKGFAPVEVEDIEPMGKYTVSFNIPQSHLKNMNTYMASFTYGRGERAEGHLSACGGSNMYHCDTGMKVAKLYKAKEETLIDGILDKDEWEDYFYGAFKLKNGFCGSTYVKWDEDFIYVAAMVSDRVHNSIEVMTEIRKGDCLFITVKPTMVQRHDSRISVALTQAPNSDMPTVHLDWSQIENPCIEQIMEKSDAKVVRNRKMTVYECKIPREAVYVDDFCENENFWFSVGIHDIDGKKEQTYELAQWVCLAEE
ncbi:MAG: hypothetical protein E7415_06155 [Ruminococcaceae bacterium]|nr:hypothetical protein [Oscillospiraceae bacterium]